MNRQTGADLSLVIDPLFPSSLDPTMLGRDLSGSAFATFLFLLLPFQFVQGTISLDQIFLKMPSVHKSYRGHVMLDLHYHSIFNGL
jgi:hypothetical protein